MQSKDTVYAKKQYASTVYNSINQMIKFYSHN